jgi:hypothetical protein
VQRRVRFTEGEEPQHRNKETPAEYRDRLHLQAYDPYLEGHHDGTHYTCTPWWTEEGREAPVNIQERIREGSDAAAAPRTKVDSEQLAQCQEEWVIDESGELIKEILAEKWDKTTTEPTPPLEDSAPWYGRAGSMPWQSARLVTEESTEGRLGYLPLLQAWDAQIWEIANRMRGLFNTTTEHNPEEAEGYEPEKTHPETWRAKWQQLFQSGQPGAAADETETSKGIEKGADRPYWYKKEDSSSAGEEDTRAKDTTDQKARETDKDDVRVISRKEAITCGHQHGSSQPCTNPMGAAQFRHMIKSNQVGHDEDAEVTEEAPAEKGAGPAYEVQGQL